MSPEDWDKHVQQWQQRGGKESNKAPDPKAPDDPKAADPPADDDQSWGGWAKSAAQTALPYVAADVLAPEIAGPAELGMAGRALGKGLSAAYKGGIGGYMANPQHPWRGAGEGALAAVGGRALGTIPGHLLHEGAWGLEGLAGLAKMAGGLHFPWLAPYVAARAASALGGLAGFAAQHFPTSVGGAGSRAYEQLKDQGDGSQ